MEGPNEHHGGDRCADGDADRPGSRHDLENKEGDKCCRHIADDRRPWLGEGRVRNAEYKHCRCPKRRHQKEGRCPQPGSQAHYESAQDDSENRAEAGPQLLAAVECRQRRVEMIPCPHLKDSCAA